MSLIFLRITNESEIRKLKQCRIKYTQKILPLNMTIYPPPPQATLPSGMRMYSIDEISYWITNLCTHIFLFC
jgi:hypothetical protein